MNHRWKPRAVPKFQFSHPCGMRLFMLPHFLSVEPRFNSRIRAGYDLNHMREKDMPAVSILASARDATNASSSTGSSLTHFNSHNRVWCDSLESAIFPGCRFQFSHSCGVRYPDWMFSGKVVSPFQFSHPCGMRRVYLFSIIGHFCFNSRIRAGCDCFLLAVMCMIICFNSHTRAGCDTDLADIYVSILTLAWGMIIYR